MTVGVYIVLVTALAVFVIYMLDQGRQSRRWRDEQRRHWARMQRDSDEFYDALWKQLGVDRAPRRKPDTFAN